MSLFVKNTVLSVLYLFQSMKSILSKKRLSFWATLVLVLGGLSSCSPTPSSNSDEIEFWTMQFKPDFTQYFEKLNKVLKVKINQ